MCGRTPSTGSIPKQLLIRSLSDCSHYMTFVAVGLSTLDASTDRRAASDHDSDSLSDG